MLSSTTASRMCSQPSIPLLPSQWTQVAQCIISWLRSMARTHELLSATQWHGISVRELIRRELAPYATSSNTEIDGPDVILKVEAGQAMGMVLHELVTNAAKYGALTAQTGRVSIWWERRVNGHLRFPLIFKWGRLAGLLLWFPKTLASGRARFAS